MVFAYDLVRFSVFDIFDANEENIVESISDIFWPMIEKFKERTSK